MFGLKRSGRELAPVPAGPIAPLSVRNDISNTDQDLRGAKISIVARHLSLIGHGLMERRAVMVISGQAIRGWV